MARTYHLGPGHRLAGKRAGGVGVRNQIGSLMLSPDQMEETKFHEMSKICGLYLSPFFSLLGILSFEVQGPSSQRHRMCGGTR